MSILPHSQTQPSHEQTTPMNPSQNLLTDIHSIISQARQNAVRSVNFERVVMYWKIGERIFEEEQNGEQRAEYGSFLIKTLAEALDRSLVPDSPHGS